MEHYKWVKPETELLFNELLDEQLTSEESHSIQKKLIDRIIELEPENRFAFFWTLACTNYHERSFLNDNYDSTEKAIEYGERAHYLHTNGYSIMLIEGLVLLYTSLTAAFLILGNREDTEKYYQLRVKYEKELGEHPDE